MRDLWSGPLVPLVGLSAVETVRLGAALLMGASPSPVSDLAISAGWTYLFVLWMDADARRSRRLPCYDFGFLVWVAFPASLVWYCIWSRGWQRGTWTLVLLLALVYGPQVLVGLLEAALVFLG